MVVLSPGDFRMGDLSGNGGAAEQPIQSITLKAPFALGRTEVTYAQFDACVEAGGCGHTPDDRGWGRGERAVRFVSQQDAREYAAWLSEVTGKPYRLPSEAEWEYAARAGTETDYYWGDTPGGGHALCADCEVGGLLLTATVASTPPNPWGLYDTLGSLDEWVADCWAPTLEGIPTDGMPRETGADCAQGTQRGGSYYASGRRIRASARLGELATERGETIGFRVARDF